MRFRWMGATEPGDVTGGIEGPSYAITAHPGTRTAAPVDDSLYPWSGAAASFIRTVYGIKTFAFTCSYSATYDYGDAVNFDYESGTFTGTISATATTEREIYEQAANVVGITFNIGGSGSGSFTNFSGITTSTTILANTFFGMDLLGSDGAASDVRYYHDPATGLWTPRVSLGLDVVVAGDDPSAGRFISSITSRGLGGRVVTGGEFLGETWEGLEITINEINPVDADKWTVDSFSFEVTRSVDWEHRNSAGAQPVWDSATSVELYPHSTLED
jgi:hypothetical protein